MNSILPANGRYTTNHQPGEVLDKFLLLKRSQRLCLWTQIPFLMPFGTLCRKNTYLHSYTWDENSQPFKTIARGFSTTNQKFWRLFHFNMKNMSHMPFFLSINNPTMVDYGTSSLWNSWIEKPLLGPNFTKLQNGLWVMSNGFGTRLVFLYCRNFRGKFGIYIFLRRWFPYRLWFLVVISVCSIPNLGTWSTPFKTLHLQIYLHSQRDEVSWICLLPWRVHLPGICRFSADHGPTMGRPWADRSFSVIFGEAVETSLRHIET